MASSPEKAGTVTLRSSDGAIFEVEESVALQMTTIKNMIDQGCAEGGISLPKVAGGTLAKVVDYGKRHAEFDASKAPKPEVDDWDREFVKVDAETLIDLMLVANFLAHQGLLDLTCQATADYIKDMSPEEVRTLFNIENDLPPEQEAELRRENAWAFE